MGAPVFSRHAVVRLVLAGLLGAGLYALGLFLVSLRVEPFPLSTFAVVAGALAAVFCPVLLAVFVETLVRRRAWRGEK